MIDGPLKRSLALMLVTVTSIITMVVSASAAAPVKLLRSSSFGREVNLTQVDAKGGALLEDLCTLTSKDVCQQAKPSSLQGGFVFAEKIASAPNGTVYVTDKGNHRVQEFTATGEFVLMFGKEVNETTGGDTCTQEEIANSNVKCKAGVDSAAPGEFSQPLSVAVDPVSENVYVAELVEGSSGGNRTEGYRVQELTADGRFVLEIGVDVNEKTGGNVCTEKEINEGTGVKCIGPGPYQPTSTVHGDVRFDVGYGWNVLAAGGKNDLLYVGQEHSVQEFSAAGEWEGEIPVPGNVRDVAINDQDGTLALVENETRVVRDFDSTGKAFNTFEIAPPTEGKEVLIMGLAFDAEGHLAVVAMEPTFTGFLAFGGLYDPSTALQVTTFNIPTSTVIVGDGFNGKGELDALAPGASQMAGEVLVYEPVKVAELVTGPGECMTGVDNGSSATFYCVLTGEVNPWGVPQTEVWFRWGRTPAFGSETPRVSVPEDGMLSPIVPVVVYGLAPSTTFYDQLRGNDEVVRFPEVLSGERMSFATPAVAPRIVGVPNVPFIRSSSAVMSGELNPENANTRYWFQYATDNACRKLEEEVSRAVELDECAGVAQSPSGQSGAYASVGGTVEATGLQPASVYRYRMVAANEAKQVMGPEARFTTMPAASVSAQTGQLLSLAPTSAIASGSVNPDGQTALYTFEMGVYAGEQTQYGIVFSGTIPASTGLVEKTVSLTSLQPGTTYAYRIAVSSVGYSEAKGTPTIFTTPGLPAVLVSPTPLAMLAVPDVVFPHTEKVRPRRKSLTNVQKLASGLRACKKKPVRRRAGCERSVRRKYEGRPKRKR